MSEPITALAPVIASGRWLRPSRRLLLVHPIIELFRSLPGLVALLFAGRSSGQGPLWSLVGLLLVVIAAVGRLLTTRYRITDEQLQLRKGLLRRRTMNVPLDRVRTVDVSAHALHRALGLAKVVIGTGTPDRRGRSRLELDGLPAPVAARLRSELLHRDIWERSRRPDDGPPAAVAGAGSTTSPGAISAPAGGVGSAGVGLLADGGPPSGSSWSGSDLAGDEREIVRLNPAWIRYAPFTLTGAVTAFALVGFAGRIYEQTRLNLGSSPEFHYEAAQLRANPWWLDVTEIGVVVVAFIALASTVGYVLAFWNFRLTRHRRGSLHISRGLLTSRATSIDRARLRGVEISEPLLLRCVGGARCLAIATGLRVGGGSERGGTILLPPAPRWQALRVAAEVLGTAAPMSAALVAHGARARRRRYLRACSWGLMAAMIFAALAALAGHGPWGLLAVPPAGLASTALAADRYRSLGHGLSAGYLVTRYGSMVRRSSSLATGAIIGWNLRTTWWQRRAGLTTLVATTAAGRQRLLVADVEVAVAMSLAESAVPGLLAQFIDPHR